MTHLFKIPTAHADLFISAVDLKKKQISWQVRDKETGLLLEPAKSEPFTTAGEQVFFDVNRSFPAPFIGHISTILNDNV